MKILSKCIGLMAVFCVIGGANAELRAGGGRAATNSTGRVSLAVNPTMGAINRLPTVRQISSTTTTSTTTSDSSLMDTNECVDAYTECIKATDVCGFDFEECTTHELFYAKKPQCNNILLQCSTAGINTLFGTTSITNLTADNMDVYPTQGSILGQFIEAGAINNRLDKSSCVKRYTSCLHKENVCGESFELCTSNNEFKKQKIYCESTLVRCTDDGKTELFGSTNVDSNPTTASRLGIMIKEGADLASVNAVSTCYKVADQCILSACSTNPYKCIVDSSLDVVNITQAIKDGLTLSSEQASSLSEMLTSANVNSYIRGACKDTIGGNRYCHMTANEGKVPSASDLIDEDVRDEIYSDIYASRMNAVMRGKIQEFANDFDKQTKDKCVETIMACAMRSCGSGLGSACYKKVFGANRDMGQSIAGDNTYTEIQTGCEAIVNTDTNCQYAAAVSKSDSTYAYTYNDRSAFTTLFPKSSTKSDPLGAVERLNAALSENYNDAAIAELKKKCRNTAVSCIRSLCGADFTNCYRNRTDVMTDTYATATNEKSEKLTVGSGRTAATYDSSEFDRSMNKVGGVLDFTIVRGLCINTVKEASSCDEHLKLEAYSLGEGEESVWGDKGSVRNAWVDAVKDNYSAKVISNEQVLIGCSVQDDKAGTCDTSVVADCGTVDEKGCLYDKKVYQSINEYQLNMAADTLFSEVLGSLEMEAQAKYNAKLTREQNMCVAANEGGIMGKKDMTATYMWAKLKNKRIPKNYSTNGLSANDFVASNDLYGSFCRARVTIQSDDPDVQAVLQKGKNWSTAYFAVGDVFTCGSWIPQSELENIAKTVSGQTKGTEAYERAQQQTVKDNRNANLIAALSALGVSTGTGFLVNKLQDQNILGGLMNGNVNTKTTAAANIRYANACKNAARSLQSETDGSKAKGVAQRLLSNTKLIQDYSGQGKNRTATAVVFNGATDIRTHCIDSFASDDCQTAAIMIENECQTVIDRGGEYDVGSGQDNTRRWISIGAAGVAGVGTFFAVRKLTRDIKNENLTAAQQEAYDQFMREVGNHIYCFIGADEAGTYGDLIEISVD